MNINDAPDPVSISEAAGRQAAACSPHEQLKEPKRFGPRIAASEYSGKT
jgi:hypothetical protein